MMFMTEWNVIMFLSSPNLKDLDTLDFSGLFINDLSMHDFSRDLLLASMFAACLTYLACLVSFYLSCLTFQFLRTLQRPFDARLLERPSSGQYVC
jgi:hypothetical protein